MTIDKATVQRIAMLARIDVSEADQDAMAKELSGIMNWIEQLKEVNTDAVAPMTGGTDMKLAWRADAVADGAQPDKVLANAPDRHEAFFAVPKVVE
ncbi:MAG: Asp-tRNA(Asn)/Glu-tRNA(Gln) amidotransferase subunit GatC [Alphaproteobacteria bacterium]|nr:Asp-tRNA(Asn)/Glu-tRNA(Gln) amidotransferase subunit GatC [Alphaproteobacteria bacterium]